MNFSILNYKFSIILLNLLLLQPVAFSESPRNLALHKKLEYTPKPEYHLTVHPRDPLKLTDGIKDQSLWHENCREKTVGWYRAPLIEIKMDLEQVKNVGHLNIYTVGGGRSGVEYPEVAAAASSLDDIHYVLSGFSTSDGWAFGTKKAIPKVFVLPVEQRARYIKFFIRPIGPYFFTDEIEVIESRQLEINNVLGDYISKEKMIDLIERVRQLQRGTEVLSAKIQKSAQSLNEPTGDWQAMKMKISQLGKYLTIEQVSKAESEFAAFRAKRLQSEYKTEWLCCPAEPMDILRYSDFPKSVPGDFQISLYQWKNEYGAAAINLVNCSSSQIMFKMNLSPLRFEDRVIDSKDIFEIRRALYVRVLYAGLVADPLVLQNAKPFPVLPGQMVQLWIEAYSKGLEAGDYTGAVAIEAMNDNITKKLQTISVHLEVADKTFPDELPFYYCNWDYITISDRFTSRNPSLVKQAAIDLKNHYINVVVVRQDRIFDNNKLKPISYKLRDELAIRSDIKPFVLLFLGGKGPLEKRFGAFQSPDWQSDFNYFLKHLRDFMRSSGFDYDSFAIYPFDESIDDDFVYVARMIREFDPKLKIYANKWFESDKQFRRVKDLIDIWCPYLFETLANKSKFDYYKDSGNFDMVWCYNTDLLYERYFAPPFTQTAKEWQSNNKKFWRTMPLTSACLGMKGAGFWVYQESDRTGWIKDKFSNYGVIYDGLQNPDNNCFAEMIIPSKCWQQWRQGVEDAVCLAGRRDLLDEFLQKPNSELNSEYLTSLRKRADKKNNNPK